MNTFPTRASTLLRLWAAFASLPLWLGLCTPAGALDLQIETEADYQSALDGIRAVEYVRQQYQEGNANPRALAAVVGLWVFAERNPLATQEQLSAFLSAYDAELSTMIPGDPMLTRSGSVVTALSSVTLSSDGDLMGMDTRVGERMLELLGLSLSGLGGYEQSKLRMTRFDLGSVQRLVQRRETIDALTGALAGVAPNGQRPERMNQIAANFLAARSFAPQLGEIDASQVEINEGLSLLPSFAEFLQVRDVQGGHLNLESAVFSDIDAIQAEADLLLTELEPAEVELGLFVNSLSLALAAADPTDPNHAAAVAALEAGRQAVIASSRRTAQQRSSAFARTLLLQQSSFPSVRNIATSTRDYTALQLQTNNTLAIAREGVGIAGSLVGVAAGFVNKDYWGAVQSLTNVVTGALGLGDILGSGPSAEAQIFEQLVELRQQVQAMEIGLNRRFDAVDRQLNIMFSTMVNSFLDLGNEIGQLMEDVDNLARLIAEQRSALDRIEDALFGFIEAGILNDLTLLTNVSLNYFNINGVGLPYQGSPGHVSAANGFYTFATSTSKLQSFAGTPDGQPIVVTLENAADVLDDPEIAIGRFLNDLRRVPSGLITSSGHPIIGPITSGRVAGAAAWAQGAGAYLQLARENPWYFNFRYRSQVGSGGSVRIEEIIQDGERIVELANAVRTHHDLFDALLTRAADDVQLFQDEVLAWIDNEMPLGFSNGTERVDPWGPLGQPVSPLLLPASQFNVSWPGGGSAGLSIPPGFAQKGMEIPAGNQMILFPPGITRAEIAERNALSHIFEVGPLVPPRIDMRLDKGAITVNSNMSRLSVLFSLDVPSGFSATRAIDFILETNCFANCSGVPAGWRPLAFRPQTAGAPQVYFDFFDAGFGTLVSEFRSDLASGDLEGEIYSSVTVGDGSRGYSVRFRVLDDVTRSEQGGNQGFTLQAQLLAEELHALRESLRNPVDGFLVEMDTPGSTLEQATRYLANSAALLNGYLTIGMADAMSQSELLRSAVRGAGSIGGLGFRAADIRQLVLHDISSDIGEVGGTAGAELTRLDEILGQRIDALGIEIDEAAANASPSFPYVELILGSLRNLVAQASNLAIDETFFTDGALFVSAEDGLLSNDIGQAGQINNEELAIDLAYFGSPDAVQPVHGSVVVAADGSFNYTPDPGFNGIDRFTYRLKAEIPGTGLSAVSLPGDVIVRVGNFDDRIFRDGFERAFR